MVYPSEKIATFDQLVDFNSYYVSTEKAFSPEILVSNGANNEGNQDKNTCDRLYSSVVILNSVSTKRSTITIITCVNTIQTGSYC